MRHMHRHMPALAVYLALFLGCVGVAACSSNARQKTLHASVLAVNAARDGLLAFDNTHQLELVEKAATREQAVNDLAVYHARREVVVGAFEVAYRALALAATADDKPSYVKALGAAKAVLDAVRALTGGV